MKRICLLSLGLLLCLAARSYDKEIDGLYYNLFPATAEAELTYGIDEAGSQIYYSKSVKIPETVMYNGVSYTVTAIGNGAFQFCNELVSVEIPASIKKIGRSAFVMSSIRSIDLGQISEIGEWAFSGCTLLESISIPKECKVIQGGAFEGCTSLKKVVLPDGVESIGSSAFWNCENLLSIDIPSSLRLIEGSAFGENLEEIVIHDLAAWCTMEKGIDLSRLKLIDGKTGKEMVDVQIPEGVERIAGRAFQGMSSLRSVRIPNSVVAIGRWAFCDCTGLTSVVFPDRMEEIGEGAFWRCTGLTEAAIPEGITSIKEYTFSDCTSLETLTIPSTITVGISEKAFSDCRSLKNVYSYMDPLYSEGHIETGCWITFDVSVSEKAFEDTSLFNATLHVPAAFLDAYKQKLPWNRFGDIVVISDNELTSINSNTLNTSSAPVDYYSPAGVPLRTPRSGINIIRMNDGTTRKVLMK